MTDEEFLELEKKFLVVQAKLDSLIAVRDISGWAEARQKLTDEENYILIDYATECNFRSEISQVQRIKKKMEKKP